MNGPHADLAKMEQEQPPLSGRVYLVGAGPGDPGLITVKGKKLLGRADVIIYDRLVNLRLLDYVRDDAERIYCGKMPDQHDIPQEEINRLLVEHALRGKMVVRLKGGDPCMFGRAGEEAGYCAGHNIPFEIVPGVTAGIAAAAYAGIPLTHRSFNPSVVFVTGHRKNGTEPGIDWERLAVGFETIVFFMGVTNLRVIQENLLQHGRSPQTPVALIRWGTWSKQETLIGSLSDIVEQVEKANFRAPALIVVGENVRLRDTLAWFEKKPFYGKKVLVPATGLSRCSGSGSGHAGDRGRMIADLVEDEGGEVISFPRVRIVDDYQWKAFPRFIPESFAKPSAYDWIVFPDGYAVEYFFRCLRELCMDVRTVSARLAALNHETAEELWDRGLVCRAVCGAMVWPRLVHPGQEVLYLGTMNRSIVNGHGYRNGNVTELSLYRREVSTEGAHEVKRLLNERAVDLAVFTSPVEVDDLMAVLNFAGSEALSNANALFDGVKVLCFGEDTAQAWERYGLTVDMSIDDEVLRGKAWQQRDVFGAKLQQALKEALCRMNKGGMVIER